MAVTIVTSTDTVEEVKAALGDTVEIEEETPAEEEGEKPAAKPAKGEEEPSEEEPAEEETPEGDEEEGEPEEEGEAKPKKAAPSMVPKSRLDKEIQRRKNAERRASELETPTEEEEPPLEKIDRQFYSGKPKPMLADFLKGVDKFDAEAMAVAQEKFWDTREAWADEEAAAKIEFTKAVEKAEDARAQLVEGFSERCNAFAKAEPDYNEFVPNSKVMLDGVQEQFIYESEVGPHMLLYFVQHPKEASRISSMRMRSKSEALLTLEAKLVKRYGVEEGTEEEEEEQPRIPKKPVAAKKTASSAPVPPARIKPGGPGPRSERELAGPEDNSGVDIKFNPELERRDLERKKLK